MDPEPGTHNKLKQQNQRIHRKQRMRIVRHVVIETIALFLFITLVVGIVHIFLGV